MYIIIFPKEQNSTLEELYTKIKKKWNINHDTSSDHRRLIN